MTCRYCSSDTSSRIENKLQVCMNCVQNVLLQDLEKKDKSVVDMEHSVSQMNIKFNDTKLKLERLTSLLDAEGEGALASSRGLPHSQNPYPEGSEKNTVWMTGWSTSEMIRSAKQAIAITKWAIDGLQVVKQIIAESDDGFERSEAIAKIETIMEKLSIIK